MVCEGCQPGTDTTGPDVVVGQSVDVVVNGEERCGRQVADLAHPAAQNLSKPVGPGDRCLVADQDGADRSAQSLGEAQRHGVGVGGVGIDADTLGDRGVEQAGPVEVDGQPAFAGRRSQRCHVLDRLYVAVHRVLEAQQGGDRVVLVGFLHGGPHVLG